MADAKSDKGGKGAKGRLAGGAAVAVLLAALDTWTWGGPFHSLLAWTRFNVLSDGAVDKRTLELDVEPSEDELIEIGVHFNVSPKLANAGMPPSRTIPPSSWSQPMRFGMCSATWEAIK